MLSEMYKIMRIVEICNKYLHGDLFGLTKTVFPRIFSECQSYFPNSNLLNITIAVSFSNFS